MVKKVVAESDLGKTLKVGHLVPNKVDVQIDNSTIVTDANGVLSTSLNPAIVNNLVSLSGVASLSTNLGAFSGTTIPDNVDVKSALQSIETAIENQNITGQFAGSSTTFAGLPTTTSDTKPVNNGDWAVLTQDDGGNVAGIYAFDGTAYVFVKSIPSQFAAAATAISPASTNGSGVVGTSVKYAREDHKHPAQAPSADSGNLISASPTDTLHVLQASTVRALATEELQDLSGNTLGYIFLTNS